VRTTLHTNLHPVDAARLHPLDAIDQTAARQIRALLGRLPASGPVPWFVFDAGYDSAQLSRGLADARVVCWYYGCDPTATSTTTRPHAGRACGDLGRDRD
jgi:hypothetical protein